MSSQSSARDQRKQTHPHRLPLCSCSPRFHLLPSPYLSLSIARSSPLPSSSPFCHITISSPASYLTLFPTFSTSLHLFFTFLLTVNSFLAPHLFFLTSYGRFSLCLPYVSHFFSLFLLIFVLLFPLLCIYFRLALVFHSNYTLRGNRRKNKN